MKLFDLINMIKKLQKEIRHYKKENRNLKSEIELLIHKWEAM